jgi:hypothetical protein
MDCTHTYGRTFLNFSIGYGICTNQQKIVQYFKKTPGFFFMKYEILSTSQQTPTTAIYSGDSPIRIVTVHFCTTSLNIILPTLRSRK